MTKTCFLHICCGLLIVTSFSILTITLWGGVLNKHCLLPFFHFSCMDSFNLNNMYRLGYFSL